MSLKNTTRFAFAALLLILLAVASVAYRNNRAAAATATAFVEVFAPAQEQVRTLTALLSESNHLLQDYLSQEQAIPEQVTDPLDQFKGILDAVADREPRSRPLVSRVRDAVDRTQIAFAHYVAQDQSEPLSDTAEHLLASVRDGLMAVRTNLGRLALLTTGADPEEPLRIAVDRCSSLLHTTEFELEAFATRDRLELGEIVDALDRSIALLGELANYDLPTETGLRRHELTQEIGRFRASVLQYHDGVRAGDEGTPSETARQLREEISRIWAATESEQFLLSQSLTRYLAATQSSLIAAGARAQRLFMLLSGVGLVVALGISLLFGRIIANRVRPLVEGARQLAGGRLDHWIDVSERDELDEVATAFNEMATRLQEKEAEVERHLAGLTQANETVRRANELLEERVNQRTEELRRAVEEARAASAAKSQFLASMSHEIRTPMNGVLGMQELLLTTELSDRQRRFTTTAHRSAVALLDILNDILDFSKMEAGKLELENVDFDLRETVEEVADLFAEHVHSKDVEFLCFVDPRSPFALRGDPGRLRQILSNLLSNAVKFTEQGEIEVRVACVEDADESACLRFEVRDTGIGIEPDALAQIFDSFAQADGSTTRKYGGTGLGLTISRQLVAMMAGEIGVESEPGAGSTFWFTAYFGKQPAGAQATAVPPTELKNLRVLVVDDNATNREILHQQLSSWGMPHAEAEGGEQALSMLRTARERGAPYDLVVLDLMMPGMDGLELAKRIQSEPSIAGVCRIMLTSGGLPSEGEARETGIQAYLSKPVRPSHLFDEIARAFRDRRANKLQGISDKGTGDGATAPLCGRILLAEDNRVNREVALGMLQSLGCVVDAAGDGNETLEALNRTQYDLVLMDCMMPRMDGYEATRTIRAKEEGASEHIPIVALTANAMEGDREACLAAGMDDYLSKPFNLEQLKVVVRRWLPRASKSPPPYDGPGIGVPPPDCETRGVVVGTPQARRPARLNRRPLDAIRALQREGGPDILRRAIEGYLEDSPKLLQFLTEAVTRTDPKAIRDAAHSLKSSSANLGADDLAALSRKMEETARAGSSNGTRELLAAIEVEYHAVSRALAAEI